MKWTFVIQIVGIALLLWFGSQIGRQTGIGFFPVAGFGIGVMCLSVNPWLDARVLWLQRRLDDVENELRSRRASA